MLSWVLKVSPKLFTCCSWATAEVAAITAAAAARIEKEIILNLGEQRRTKIRIEAKDDLDHQN